MAIAYRRAWAWSRDAVLSEAAARSPLARRPCGLKAHLCVSAWLNAGVSETLVPQWAGHSVAVLKKIYAKCLVGKEATQTPDRGGPTPILDVGAHWP